MLYTVYGHTCHSTVMETLYEYFIPGISLRDQLVNVLKSDQSLSLCNVLGKQDLWPWTGSVCDLGPCQAVALSIPINTLKLI